jgi:thiol-disulfide isomerase/thioredoxin
MSISIGPFAFPFQPLWVLLSFAVAGFLAGLWASPDRARALRNLAQSTFWVSLIASRASYLAQHATVYLAQPLAVLDIRDAGWDAPAGLVAILGWLVWRLRDRADLRFPAWRAAILGLTLWGAGSVWEERQHVTAVPQVAVTELHQGETRQLHQLLDGRPLVVNLWATWCGPCRYEMPALSQAQQNNPHIRFVFINQGESAQRVKTFIAQQGWALNDVWLDPARSTGKVVGSTGLPTTLFFDSQGRLVKIHMGVLTPTAIDAQLMRFRPS